MLQSWGPMDMCDSPHSPRASTSQLDILGTLLGATVGGVQWTREVAYAHHMHQKIVAQFGVVA